MEEQDAVMVCDLARETMRNEPARHMRRNSLMLFMVVERFRNGDWRAVGERFRARGRMMPEGSGAAYVASWLSADGRVCYQLMDSPSRESLDGWIANWSDLVDFEVIEVEASAEFWKKRAEGA